MKKLPAVIGTSAMILAAFLFLIHSKNVSAATNHVVISQIEVGSTGAATDEFVELYNPTPNDIDLSSWRLSRKNSGGTQDNLVASLSGTIKSHGYFLIGSPAYSGSVSANQTYSTGSTIANNNAVILFSDAGITTVDLVGIGPTAPASESASAPTPINSGSIQRKIDDTGGHGLDTDNNSGDFELLAVSSPRNSSVVISPASSPTLTLTPTLTPTPTLEPTATPTQEPSATPTPTEEPSPTLTPTPEPSSTPTPTIEITASPTPSVTPTISMSPTPTLMPSPTPTPSGTIIVNSPHLVCYLTKKEVNFLFFKVFIPTIGCTKI